MCQIVTNCLASYVAVISISQMLEDNTASVTHWKAQEVNYRMVWVFNSADCCGLIIVTVHSAGKNDVPGAE